MLECGTGRKINTSQRTEASVKWLSELRARSSPKFPGRNIVLSDYSKLTITPFELNDWDQWRPVKIEEERFCYYENTDSNITEYLRGWYSNGQLMLKEYYPDGTVKPGF